MAPAIADLADTARRGRALDVLPELLRLAGDDNVGDAERAWQAAAAAIKILFWQDRFVEAGELAQNTITRCAPSSGIARQDVPFDVALLAAEVHAGIPAAPRLRELSSKAPRGSALADRLAWLAHELGTSAAVDHLPGNQPWDVPPAPLLAPARNWAQREPAGLTDRQRAQLWEGLWRANQVDAAWDLYRTVGPPPRWYVAMWLAGAAAANDADLGRQVVAEARVTWIPYAVWDCLPSDPVVQPRLRPLADHSLRDLYLTSPVGRQAGGMS